jgi:hypothetical protein
MSSTIESINVNLNNKINGLEELLTIYESHVELIQKMENELNDIRQQKKILKNVFDNYTKETIDIIVKYHTEPENRKSNHNTFIRMFHAINITGELNKIFVFCKKLDAKYKLRHDLFKKYEFYSIDETFEDIGSNFCKQCKELYLIDEKASEFMCRKCGRSEKMYGEVFEDEQFFYQEGTRTKHGKYEPTKHCKFWVDRIQAKESLDVPEIILNKIKKCIRRDKIWIENVNCEIIRYYLKELKITNYNNHIPLICKLITKKEPPQFTDHELKLIYFYFSIVIQLFNKTKSNDKSNCPYHPFFIYKIVEQILNKPEHEKRKKEILSCIHLQSNDTLIENDNTWFLICDYIPEFTKITTKK